jgi:Protein of unknown function (DUF3631)/Domain of unknown function (DUF3854)
MAVMRERRLVDRHREQLERESAIAPEVIEGRGYFSIERTAELKPLGFGTDPARAPALALPLHCTVKGEPPSYSLRLDTPVVTNGRTRKYLFPYRWDPHLDVHPNALAAVRSNRLPPDGKVLPLFVTEGAKKADALLSAGARAVLSIPGVWNWKGKNAGDGVTTLPDWDDVHLKGRRVFLTFDSDAMTNPQVATARRRLGEWLGHRGAEVLYVLLPAGDAGEKVGADDFLAGGHSLQDLVALATEELPPPPGAAKQEQRDPGLPVDGGQLLLDLSRLARRLVVMTGEQALVYALWVVHTWVPEAFDVTPYLHVLAPTKRAGKTRLAVDVSKLVVHRPQATANMSDAALFRVIEKRGPTVLFDEVDSVFGKRSEREDLRAMLNAGWQRGAPVLRCVGEGANQDVAEFPVFCPKILAGIGKLPDTIADRSLPIRLERRTRDQKIERFRERKLIAETTELRDRLERWAIQNVDALKEIEPELPDELDDRGQDIAEPLLAVAELIGGDWPDEARRAIAKLRAGADIEDDQLGIRLLADIRTVFGERDRITTKELLERLNDLDESPWPGWGKQGKGLSAKTLADLLRDFGIKSRSIQVEHGQATTAKGFLREQFEDAWSRYLPADTPKTRSETSGRQNPHSRAENSPNPNVRRDGVCREENGRNPAPQAGSDVLTFEDAVSGSEEEKARVDGLYERAHRDPNHPAESDTDAAAEGPLACGHDGPARLSAHGWRCPTCNAYIEGTV